jgi:hypothetical protein
VSSRKELAICRRDRQASVRGDGAQASPPPHSACALAYCIECKPMMFAFCVLNQRDMAVLTDCHLRLDDPTTRFDRAFGFVGGIPRS